MYASAVLLGGSNPQHLHKAVAGVSTRYDSWTQCDWRNNEPTAETKGYFVYFKEQFIQKWECHLLTRTSFQTRMKKKDNFGKMLEY